MDYHQLMVSDDELVTGWVVGKTCQQSTWW